ncbi:isochorismatase family protein [Amycolatopsis sp. FDAARGOS 1241]|uniref:isochorismatase family protein n=1 Tax=Amycolatopsis sp. FDAARGOS 1241 TaxID=2778070 RepID=UPI001950195C|nr:isochorismatase family protein [Amycolatopsis sp. FDAARGOS 1241]QRP49362.1 isochorismatase family protein [Amycolatopsis sp. FDAARGOS 1241]
MTAPWWSQLFDGEEARAYHRQHGGDRRPLGQRPVVLVVDVTRAFTGEEGETLDESTARWPTSCGPNAWTAIPYLRQVIDLAIARGWPLVYTTAEVGAAARFGGTVKGELSAMGSPMDLPGAQEIPDAIAPPAGALVLAKPKASAFFDTSLVAHLIRLGADSLVVTGATTSGCVRATVVDGHSHGWPVFVVEDACFDRARLSHGVNLFEMNAKYADVLTTTELTELAG